MYEKIIETLENNNGLYYKIKNKEEAVQIASELAYNYHSMSAKDFIDLFDAGNDCLILYEYYEWDYGLMTERDALHRGKTKYNHIETLVNPTYDDLAPLFSDVDNSIKLDIVQEYDTVERPKHYNVFEREVIYVIKDLLDNNDNYSGFESYCIGNSLKYIFRAGIKVDYYEDLEKARYYINKILEGKES